MMPDLDGIEVLRYLAGRECTASIVIMSGHNSTMLGRAERLGAGPRPEHLRQLAQAVPSQGSAVRAHERLIGPPCWGAGPMLAIQND